MELGAIALFIPIIALCIPITAIIAHHRLKLAELNSRKPEGGGAVEARLRAEIDELRQQVASLRETTTKFDLAFDASLDSLEDRMKRMEDRQIAARYENAETGNAAVYQQR